MKTSARSVGRQRSCHWSIALSMTCCCRPCNQFTSHVRNVEYRREVVVCPIVCRVKKVAFILRQSGKKNDTVLTSNKCDYVNEADRQRRVAAEEVENVQAVLSL